MTTNKIKLVVEERVGEKTFQAFDRVPPKQSNQIFCGMD
jgi:hypothetical protein